jgi:outer membrane protein
MKIGGGDMMKAKRANGILNGYLAMVVAFSVFCFGATAEFAHGQELIASPDTNQLLLADMDPDYPGVDTADAFVVQKKEPAWALGAGVGVVPDYEGSDDYQGVPLLFLRAAWNSGRYIQFLGNTLKVNVIAGNAFQFGPVVQYRGERDDDVDNEKVKRMRQVDEAIEIGAFVGYRIGNWHTSLQAANDVNDAHDGLVVTLEGGYTMPLAPGVLLGLSLFSSYANDDYMETYFSVDANNASRSGLRQYSADSGIKDIGTMVNLAYAPWDKWGITGLLGLRRLLGDAKDSPLVDQEGSENQLFGGVMVTYRF